MPVIRPEPPLAIVQRLVIGALREPASVLELPAAELDLALRLMRRARLLGRLGWKLRELAPVDMVLHAMTHLFYGSEMDDSIRELVDVADLLEFCAQREPGFWDGFWPRAEALDLTLALRR